MNTKGNRTSMPGKWARAHSAGAQEWLMLCVAVLRVVYGVWCVVL